MNSGYGLPAVFIPWRGGPHRSPACRLPLPATRRSHWSVLKVGRARISLN